MLSLGELIQHWLFGFSLACNLRVMHPICEADTFIRRSQIRSFNKHHCCSVLNRLNTLAASKCTKTMDGGLQNHEWCSANRGGSAIGWYSIVELKMQLGLNRLLREHFTYTFDSDAVRNDWLKGH